MVFDFGILPFKGRDFDLDILVFTSAGSDNYISTRDISLKGSDGIFFVLDCREEFVEQSLKIWDEMTLYIGKTIFNLPLVICFNKQDLKEVLDLKNSSFSSLIYEGAINKLSKINTIALKGLGIIEAFKILLKDIFPVIEINLEKMEENAKESL